ncbi:MAG: carboxylesterase family protein [Halieaceae bacterium]|nr:carboxylesterase family protein [Halieaceae bacterium]
MISTRVVVLPLLVATLAACSDGGDSHRATPETIATPEVEQGPTLDLSFTEPPIDLPGLTVNYAEDVAYGDGERNLFDIYLPDCSGPTPLVIYIHGGGFFTGDKSSAHEDQPEVIAEFLESCIAYATISYALFEIPEEGESLDSAAEQGGVLTSLLDSARALQFMRYHFESLNIEADNVALYGASAGAGTSLWLGTHDDLADADNSDPVLRESTRVKAVGALATQSTYDIIDWEQILLPITEPFAAALGGTDIVTVASAVGASNYLLTFLGIASLEEIDSQANIDYRANVDMLELMDAGDAPIYVHNFEVGLDDLLNVFLHHGVHAHAVKDRADEVGLHSVAYVEDAFFGLEDPSGEGLVSFLTRHIR